MDELITHPLPGSASGTAQCLAMGLCTLPEGHYLPENGGTNHTGKASPLAGKLTREQCEATEDGHWLERVAFAERDKAQDPPGMFIVGGQRELQVCAFCGTRRYSQMWVAMAPLNNGPDVPARRTSQPFRRFEQDSRIPGQEGPGWD